MLLSFGLVFLNKDLCLRFFEWGLRWTGNTEDLQNIPKDKTDVLLVFHHPSCFDHVALFRWIKPTPQLLYKKNYIPWGLNWLSYFFPGVPVDSNTMFSSIYKISMDPTKLLAIAPGGGYAWGEKPSFLPPFKIGAFYMKHKILPVLILFDPPYKSQTVLSFLWESWTTPRNYILKILPLMESPSNETNVEYSERVWKEMKSHLTLFYNTEK